MGITLIPEMALKRETRGADVAITRLCKPRPTRRIGMVWRSSSPLSDHLRRIAELIGAEYHSLRQQAGPEIPA